MPTLGDLHLAVFPTAVRLAPPGAAPFDAPVAWVRVMKARTPAFDALERGDLAIVPEAALDLLAGQLEAPDGLAAVVRGAGACAILLLGHGADSAAAASQAVAREAAATGLAVLRLPGGDVETLERAVIGYLVNTRAELDRQAGTLEARLEQLALAGAGAEAYAGAVAAFIGRAIAIEGARGEPLAVHAPAVPADAARAAGRYLADHREVAERVPLAGAGALVLLGPGPVTELERTVAGRIAPLLALALGRVATGTVAARPRPEGLPADGPPWVVLMARQLVPGEAGRPEAREVLRLRLRRLAPSRLLALRGDVDSLELRLVAVAPPDDPLALGLAARVAAAAGRPVAVSRPFTAGDARAVAEAEARATLEAAQALPDGGPGGAQVARADRLSVYRLLGNLHHVPEGRIQAEALLAPLVSRRPARRLRQLATLQAVLERPGLAAAAAALGIHRNTLGYRIRTLERQTGWRLDDPDLRLALLIALRLVRYDQEEGTIGPGAGVGRSSAGR